MAKAAFRLLRAVPLAALALLGALNAARACACVPDLTAAQTHHDEVAAMKGDLSAARELYWRYGPERHKLHWLLFAARRGDCQAIEMAVIHYDGSKQRRSEAHWIEAQKRAKCPPW